MLKHIKQSKGEIRLSGKVMLPKPQYFLANAFFQKGPT